MVRRLVIKTVIICSGIFISLLSILCYFFFSKYGIDTEKRYEVFAASTAISEGSIINESQIIKKVIRESDLSKYMVSDYKAVLGRKALANIGDGDYLRSYELLPREKWFKNDERVLTLGMDVEERLANLIKKGSLVDIKVLLKDVKSAPKVVLSKVKVMDLIDENGISTGNDGVNKKLYAELVLDENQRDRLYIAQELGKLVFELYTDPTQKGPQVQFEIPDEYQSKGDVKPADASTGLPPSRLPR